MENQKQFLPYNWQTYLSSFSKYVVLSILWSIHKAIYLPELLSQTAEQQQVCAVLLTKYSVLHNENTKRILGSVV